VTPISTATGKPGKPIKVGDSPVDIAITHNDALQQPHASNEHDLYAAEPADVDAWHAAAPC
jgi:hypothetical protein